MPEISLKKLLFPEPLCPIRRTLSPFIIARLILFNAMILVPFFEWANFPPVKLITLVVNRLVRDLVSEYQSSGYKSIKWDATNNFGESVSAGMYFYKVDFGELKQVRKMLYIK